MGGVASSSKNNDDLIDNLLEADYIKTSLIERVSRAVDRAEYFLPEARSIAYKDIAWKSGNLHLSAPCIYSEVMEALCLAPGLSFLNLGSGTGYLSTMAGLVLGSYGANHGIEYYADVVSYANKKLEEFKRFSGAIDEFDFCEPKFIQGNALCLNSDSYGRYDRVYCSAACPELYDTYMKNLVKVGGILVMPYNDQLLQIKRTSQTNWVGKSLLPVSFASIIQPPAGSTDSVHLIEIEPMPLQAICRAVVRSMLRENIESEHPQVKRAPKTKRRALRRLVVPLVESEDSSDEERSLKVGGCYMRTLSLFNNGGGGGHSETKEIETPRYEEHNGMETAPETPEEREGSAHQNETKVETRAVIEHIPSTSHTDDVQSSSSQNTPERSVGPHSSNGSYLDRKEDEDDEGTSLDSINAMVDILDVLRRNEEIEDSDDGWVALEGGEHSKRMFATKDNKKKKRVKIYSGSLLELETRRKSATASSSDEDSDHQEKRRRRVINKRDCLRGTVVRQVIGYSSSEVEDEPPKVENEMRMYESSYTEHMKTKIQNLPLPPILKRYLNFYREF